MQPHTVGKITSFAQLTILCLMQPQNVVCPLGCQGILLAHVKPAVVQHPCVIHTCDSSEHVAGSN